LSDIRPVSDVSTLFQHRPLRRATAQSCRPFAFAVADAASQSYSMARNSTVHFDPIRVTIVFSRHDIERTRQVSFTADLQT